MSVSRVRGLSVLSSSCRSLRACAGFQVRSGRRIAHACYVRGKPSGETPSADIGVISSPLKRLPEAGFECWHSRAHESPMRRPDCLVGTHIVLSSAVHQ
jgi:hypothetical protein